MVIALVAETSACYTSGRIPPNFAHLPTRCTFISFFLRRAKGVRSNSLMVDHRGLSAIDCKNTRDAGALKLRLPV
jgi:hypothetical protein